MNKEGYVLSIAIPTLNRLSYLSELLKQIVPLIEELPIEICISANKTDDGTHDFLRTHFIKKVENVNCILQEKLLDIDSNMMAAIELAKGQYVYPLGDDDFLEKEAIVKILKKIKENQNDMILLNGFHTDQFLNPNREHIPDLLKGKLYDCPIKAFSEIWHLMPFGSFVAKRGMFDTNLFYKYKGTSHAYTGMVWESLLKKKCKKIRSVSCVCKNILFI